MLAVAREEYGRLAYSHKAHEKMVERLSARVRRERIINAVVLTATAGSTIDVLVRDETVSKYVSLVLSAIALFVTVHQLSSAPEKLLDQHRLTARALWLLREQYLHLIADLKSGALGADEARTIRDSLTRKAAEVYSSAPDTDANAYAAAQRALKEREDLTFSSQEIDLLLPPGLREGGH
jgi:hypothetical protein